MKRFGFVFAFVLVGLLGWAGSAEGQTASVSGNVADAGGGVLPGVTISATNTASGRETVVLSDDDGGYEITGLTIGPYRIVASLDGFADAGRSVQLAGDETIDFSMQLGAMR